MSVIMTPTLLCECCGEQRPGGHFHKGPNGHPYQHCKACHVLISTGMMTFSMARARAENVLAALRSGLTLKKICDPKDGSHPLCSRVQIRKYGAEHPAWGAEAEMLAKANAKAADALKGVGRNLTHCSRGHAFAEYGRPNGRKRAPPDGRWRVCVQCTKENDVRPGIIKPALIAVARKRIEAGDPISSFVGGGRPGYLMAHRTFAGARRADPELDAWVTLKTASNRNTGQQKRWAKLRAQPPKIIRAAPALTGIIAAQPDRRYAAVDEAVSRRLPRDLRNEVMSLLIFELLENRITISQERGLWS